ncbi:MAG: M23 family metallopeptidase [Bdellovibrionales bacterium]|nr:M23 family metallopeptidase [Bdellovibrionales bacterium]
MICKDLEFKFFYSFTVLFFLSSCHLIQKTKKLNFQFPLKKYHLTQKYKAFHKKLHLGIDLKAPLGTPVLSVERGIVVYVGSQFTGYGKVILIEHSPHWTSLYAHLNSFQVKLGQKLQKGQQIGTVGQTGKATGVHLHFELFFNKKNVNPLNYFKY